MLGLFLNVTNSLFSKIKKVSSENSKEISNKNNNSMIKDDNEIDKVIMKRRLERKIKNANDSQTNQNRQNQNQPIFSHIENQKRSSILNKSMYECVKGIPSYMRDSNENCENKIYINIFYENDFEKSCRN